MFRLEADSNTTKFFLLYFRYLSIPFEEEETKDRRIVLRKFWSK